MRRALILMGLTGLNTVVVFAYQWFVVTRLGASIGTDALFAGMVVPQLVLSVVSGSLVFVLVPMLSVISEAQRGVAVSSFVAALAIVFGGLAAALWVLAPWWVPITLPGFSVEAIAQTIVLTRIQLVGMCFAGLATPLSAAYQARGRFVTPATCALVASTAALVIVVALLESWGVVAAAWGLSARHIIQFGLQLPAALPVVRPDFRHERVRDALRKLRPLIAGTTYYKTDQLLDRFLASMAPLGTLSLLHLAQQMYAAASQVLINAVAAPIVPRLSAHALAGRLDAFNRDMLKALKELFAWGCAVFLVVVLLGRPAFDLMFGFGVFDAQDVEQLWVIMLALGLVWFSGLAGHVFSTSFYAAADTLTPTRIGVIGFTVGIPLKVAGFYLYGVVGIALATGIFAAGNAFAMHLVLRNRIRNGSVFNNDFR